MITLLFKILKYLDSMGGDIHNNDRFLCSVKFLDVMKYLVEQGINFNKKINYKHLFIYHAENDEIINYFVFKQKRFWRLFFVNLIIAIVVTAVNKIVFSFKVLKIENIFN